MKSVLSAKGWRTFLLFVGFFATLLMVREAFLDLYLVVSESMEETLVDGDLVLVDKTGFSSWTRFLNGGEPRVGAGDVVLYRVEGGDPDVRVKRVVGVPGDTLEMRNGVLRRNGRSMEERYAWRAPWPPQLPLPPMRWHANHALGDGARIVARPTPDDWGPVQLPAERYFVLGDRRARSVDSRHDGPVRAADLIGRPVLVVFSYGRRTAKPLPWLQAVRTARIGPVQ